MFRRHRIQYHLMVWIHTKRAGLRATIRLLDSRTAPAFVSTMPLHWISDRLMPGPEAFMAQSQFAGPPCRVVTTDAADRLIACGEVVGLPCVPMTVRDHVSFIRAARASIR